MKTRNTQSTNDEVSNILEYHKNINQDYTESPHYPFQNGYHQGECAANISKDTRGRESICVRGKNVIHLKIELPYTPARALLGIYQKASSTYNIDTCPSK